MNKSRKCCYNFSWRKKNIFDIRRPKQKLFKSLLSSLRECVRVFVYVSDFYWKYIYKYTFELNLIVLESTKQHVKTH